MINQFKAIKLIKIYSIICDRFEKDLKYICRCFSNNDKQDVTDLEIMTIYLFAAQEEQRFSVKQINKYACDYLFDRISNSVRFHVHPNRKCLSKT